MSNFRTCMLSEISRICVISSGSYTAEAGIPDIVHRVSEFITRRDCGAPSYPENIHISSGSQWSLMVTQLITYCCNSFSCKWLIRWTWSCPVLFKNMLKVLVNSRASPRTGVLIPVPCHSTTIVSIMTLGAAIVPYYLTEKEGWKLQVEELQRAVDSGKRVCNPVALYIVNPGNPAGCYIPLEFRWCWV